MDDKAGRLIELARKAAKSTQAAFVPGLSALLLALADYVEWKEGKA